MKTLDEVIDNFEKACDLEKRCEECEGCLSQENGCPNDGADVVPDALHYLKEYRTEKEMYNNAFDLMEKAKKRYHEAEQQYITAHANLYAEEPNDPLSWDELKQMEGKPVWVEIGGKGAWHIVWRTGKIYEGEDPDTWMWFYVGHKLPKTTYDSNGWQAYRKEKENDPRRSH